MASKTLLESLNPKGHLEIIKKYSDAHEETVLDDHNVITVGMGITLASLFSNTEALATADNYSIAYFQIGETSGSMVSGTSKLANPLEAAQYGNSDLTLSSISIGGTGATYAQDSAHINPSYISKTSSSKVTYSLVIEEAAANSISIKEIGLFSKNPLLESSPLAYLCAYRSFAGITKTDAFALIFKWTLEF